MSTPQQGGCDTRAVVIGIVTIIVGLLGFILSVICVSGCDFIHIGGSEPTAAGWCYANFGLFNFEPLTSCTIYGATHGSCTDMPDEWDEYLGGSYKAAKAFGALAPTFGGVAMLMSFFQIFLKFPPALYRTMGGLFMAAFVFQPLTFLALNVDLCNGDYADYQQTVEDSEYDCTPGPTAIVGIIAAFFYLVAGILFFATPAPERAMISCAPSQQAGQPQQQPQPVMMPPPVQQFPETVTETINPDGSKTITTEVTNPDGSKTVTTSVVSPNQPF